MAAPQGVISSTSEIRAIGVMNWRWWGVHGPPSPPQWDRSMSKWLIQMILEKGLTKEQCQYSIMLNNARSQWYKYIKMHYYELTQQRLSLDLIAQVNDSTLSKSKTITIIILSIPLSFFLNLKSNEFSKEHSNGFLITFLASLRNWLS